MRPPYNPDNFGNHLAGGIVDLVEKARGGVALYLNRETTLLYWSVGNFIKRELKDKNQIPYGAKILKSLSTVLTQQIGKGFSYSALTRMLKVATVLEADNVATLSQHLSWSHCIELAGVENQVKIKFYILSCIREGWNVRTLRKQIDGLLYERMAITTVQNEVIPEDAQQGEGQMHLSPELVFKSTYLLDFLDLPAF